MNDERLNKKVFLWTKEQNCYNWCKRVRNMFPEICNDIDQDAVLAAVKCTMVQKVKESWTADINREHARSGIGGNKLRMYRELKDSICTEPYLKQVMPKSHRSAFAKFRAGVAPLNIELGRHIGLPLDQRLCFACKAVESEVHVLIECNYYNALREDLFNKSQVLYHNFNQMSALEKYRLVMSTNELQRPCARTCNDILKMHRHLTRKT